jgi:hypothetical protein
MYKAARTRIALAIGASCLTLGLSSGAMARSHCDWSVEVKRTNTWFARDQALRSALLQGPGLNNEALERVQAQMLRQDRELESELDELVERCGWPTTTEFGDKAPQYAAMIVQHAVDLDYQLKYLSLVKAAAESGELAKRHWATLEDRVRMRQGRPQLYGTQLTMVNDELAMWAIEDEEHLDERRAEVGMVPVQICSYLGLFDRPIKYRPCDLDRAAAAPGTDPPSPR